MVTTLIILSILAVGFFVLLIGIYTLSDTYRKVIDEEVENEENEKTSNP